MLISMAKKGWERAQRATVTRRDGWTWLVYGKPTSRRPTGEPEIYTAAELMEMDLPDEPAGIGEVLEMIEWSPRVGSRWVCEECGWLGPTYAARGTMAERQHPKHLALSDLVYRGPRRGLWIRVVDVRREPLGAITGAEVTLEGFPELSRDEFLRLYLGRPTGPIALDDVARPVTRIEYEHLHLGAR